MMTEFLVKGWYMTNGAEGGAAMAETNYYNIRQSYRTCTNYRILYQRRSFGSIINYEKCESSLSTKLNF
jgi:hypothetical protein